MLKPKQETQLWPAGPSNDRGSSTSSNDSDDGDDENGDENNNTESSEDGEKPTEMSECNGDTACEVDIKKSKLPKTLTSDLSDEDIEKLLLQ